MAGVHSLARAIAPSNVKLFRHVHHIYYSTGFIKIHCIYIIFEEIYPKKPLQIYKRLKTTHLFGISILLWRHISPVTWATDISSTFDREIVPRKPVTSPFCQCCKIADKRWKMPMMSLFARFPIHRLWYTENKYFLYLYWCGDVLLLCTRQ